MNRSIESQLYSDRSKEKLSTHLNKEPTMKNDIVFVLHYFCNYRILIHSEKLKLQGIVIQHYPTNFLLKTNYKLIYCPSIVADNTP